MVKDISLGKLSTFARHEPEAKVRVSISGVIPSGISNESLSKLASLKRAATYTKLILPSKLASNETFDRAIPSAAPSLSLRNLLPFRGNLLVPNAGFVILEESRPGSPATTKDLVVTGHHHAAGLPRRLRLTRNNRPDSTGPLWYTIKRATPE